MGKRTKPPSSRLELAWQSVMSTAGIPAVARGGARLGATHLLQVTTNPNPNPNPDPNPNQVASFFEHALGISEPFRYRGTTLTPTLALAPTLTLTLNPKPTPQS